VGAAILFQDIQAVAVPPVNDFGYRREIEDRVLAPLPVALVAAGKIVAGGLQCLAAGLIVFPIATVVPATPVHMDVQWPVLLSEGFRARPHPRAPHEPPGRYTRS
jgi:ABC-2 type transport system permease protein